ncbi:ribbon-helix-helix protein, CopG family [Teichococcus aestuarii]|uniref:ribbon-helix-helix protein, CopG family n=1 Tax=Teichococcus aestuarii TaxID=568898 RepID=UPI003605AEEB
MSQAPKPAARLTPDLLVRKGEVHAEPPKRPENDPLVQLTSRVKSSTVARLREYAHRSQVSKQEIIEAALQEYLGKMGG